MGNTVVTNMGRKLKEERVYVYVWLIHFAVRQKLVQRCKAILQKKLKKKTKQQYVAHSGDRMVSTAGVGLRLDSD